MQHSIWHLEGLEHGLWVKNQVLNDFVALYIIIPISKVPVCYSIIRC